MADKLNLTAKRFAEFRAVKEDMNMKQTFSARTESATRADNGPATFPLKAPVAYHMFPCWLRGLAALGSRKRKHYTRETGGDWAAVRVPAAV